MLAQLGQFTEARPGAAGEHSYLPDAAMALIAQYQRNPLLAAAAAGDPAAEDTRGRHLRLLHRAARLLPAQAPTPGPGQARGPGTGSRPRAGGGWVGAHLAWVGWVSVGAALVVGGVILGASLSQLRQPPPPGLPPARGAARRSAAPSTRGQARPCAW